MPAAKPGLHPLALEPVVRQSKLADTPAPSQLPVSPDPLPLHRPRAKLIFWCSSVQDWRMTFSCVSFPYIDFTHDNQWLTYTETASGMAYSTFFVFILKPLWVINHAGSIFFILMKGGIPQTQETTHNENVKTTEERGAPHDTTATASRGHNGTGNQATARQPLATHP